MLTDPIADMLTRLRNAILARQEELEMPLSQLKAAVAEVLKLEGYVEDCQTKPGEPQGVLHLKLRYKGNQAAIKGLQRVSKPSRRVYVAHDQIPKVMSGLGISILSTPRGVLSDRQARQQKVGGEILCTVW